MSAVRIRFAASLYDRMLALYTGEVKAQGIELDFEPFFSPRAVFDRMTGKLEFDVAEMSMSEFMSRFTADQCPFVAIPVFPSRAFRHGMISINTRSGISQPSDLAGKRIGVPLYTMSAAVWIRGMLQEHFSVDLSACTWVQGAINASGKHGDPNVLPMHKPVHIVQNETGKTLSELISLGEIDATIGTTLPEAIRTDKNVRRLFEDFKAVEKDYYERTRIFPIMHVMVIRKELYEQHPFIASSIYRACEESKQAALKRLRYLGAPVNMIPWLPADVDEIADLFGGDPYPYGLDANRHTLEKFMEYLLDQSIIGKRVPIDDLFVNVDG
ncbi:MAG: ABC transporter substrate-binding protein [Burkholderiales bacterium]|nr:ABC transporter substrate-binding protein [Burkholderiales bacterium]